MKPLATLLALIAGVLPQCQPTPGEPGTTITGRCTQWEPTLTELAPPQGWDVVRMSKIMWRESRCWPGVRSRTSDSGLLQVNQVNHAYLTTTLGTTIDRYTLLDPTLNIKAAAALCTYWRNAVGNCYTPWGG